MFRLERDDLAMALLEATLIKLVHGGPRQAIDDIGGKTRPCILGYGSIDRMDALSQHAYVSSTKWLNRSLAFRRRGEIHRRAGSHFEPSERTNQNSVLLSEEATVGSRVVLRMIIIRIYCAFVMFVCAGAVGAEAVVSPSPQPTAESSPATIAASVTELSAQRALTERSKIYRTGAAYGRWLDQVAKDSGNAFLQRAVFDRVTWMRLLSGAIALALLSLFTCWFVWIVRRRAGELESTRPVVTVCRAGGRSAQATVILRQAGFASVANLAGGMLRWRAESRVVENGSM